MQMESSRHQIACGMEFTEKKNALKRKQHDMDTVKYSRKNQFYQCDYCGSKFSWASTLIKHIRKIHSDNTNQLIGVGNKKMTLLCPHGSCAEHVRNYAVLRQHLADKHDFIVEYEELAFNSIEDFELWKDSIQDSTLSLYTRSTAARTLKLELGRRLYYNCHRSNVYTHRRKKIRPTKSMSNKTGKACPSRLEVTYSEYKRVDRTIITVKYWKTHCGHNNHIEKLPINRQLRCLLADKLKEGWSFKEIFNWAHNSEQHGGVYKRLQHLRQNDLNNILREFKIKRHTKKIVSKSNNNLMANKNNILIRNNSKNEQFNTKDSKLNMITLHDS